MNTRTLIVIVVGIFAVALPASAEGTGEAPVAVNTTNLPTHVRVRLEEAAQQGQRAVIQFVYRTRMIHMLRAEEVLADPEAADIADAGGLKLAEATEKQEK